MYPTGIWSAALPNRDTPHTAYTGVKCIPPFYYSASPDGGKVAVELNPIGWDYAKAEVVILDLRQPNGTLLRIPKAHHCLWEDSSRITYCDPNWHEFVRDLASSNAKLVGTVRGPDGEAHINYLVPWFLSDIRLVCGLVHTLVAKKLLHPRTCFKNEASIWYLRSRNIPLLPPLSITMIDVTLVGPSACASPSGRALAYRVVGPEPELIEKGVSGRDAGGFASGMACGLYIVQYETNQEVSLIHLIQPGEGRWISPRMTWLSDDRHLLFVESQFRKTGPRTFPALLTHSIFLYDLERRRKVFVTEGDMPQYLKPR